jgi:hypothetical protein
MPKTGSCAARASVTAAFLVVGCGLATAACGDALRDQAVAALGPEDPRVPPGPLHRSGQPCLLCHQQGGSAPSFSTFSVAGTVFVDATAKSPAPGVSVIVIDRAGGAFTATTNCAGNFYVRPDSFIPSYPMWVTLRAGSVQRDMDSASYREGSCAACHAGARGPASAGPVYLINDPKVEVPPPQCH